MTKNNYNPTKPIYLRSRNTPLAPAEKYLSNNSRPQDDEIDDLTGVTLMEDRLVSGPYTASEVLAVAPQAVG